METHIESHAGASRVMMEGTYSPANYLEEAVTLDRPDYTALIAGGRIEVSFREPEPLPDADHQAAVNREVGQVFQTRMILTCRPWEMTALTLKRRYPDGSSVRWLSASDTLGLSDWLDMVATDLDGNVVADTKAERLADERRFREQTQRHAEDLLLQGLIASFRRAVADPADRMTHLYEIRDALSRHFGGKPAVRNVLGLTNAEWSDLGRIADHEPIQESRHRGNHPVLRQATEDEQTRVFEVARRMIRAYLDHLDLRGCRAVPAVTTPGLDVG